MYKKLAFVLLYCWCLLIPFQATSAPPPASAEYLKAVAAYEHGDFNAAAAAFAALERAGDVNARGSLSLMYLQGRGVPRNVEAAERLSQSAAIEGVATAQFVQGLMHSEVEGRVRNYSEAVKWYSLAANQGYTAAQANLGAIYFAGKWVPQDLKLGLLWTEKAANQGAAIAQENMGRVYYEGVGTEVDFRKAANWYVKAARQGSTAALNFLGIMYIKGTGFRENKVIAYAFFDIAGKRGLELARMNQARLHPQLTADELKQALRHSSNWKVGSPLPGE
ncbi:tetratricopeptide repeat protein [Eleftheria terrae]|uniref:tetratricopeptide repeat protein n=1 Tax=Eleftheria terrae TaxID=1597781 RepID=UPI00263AA1D6|nr:tetratricopeptide repeat protein [Eleftheria terrae]WKB56050.1 sel1 repeat family protein [Eleftheria terrae]